MTGSSNANSVNATVASRFDEVAMILEKQDANPFRVAAYRQGASTLRALNQPVTEIIEKEGMEGLMRLQGIGSGLSRAIHLLVTTGSLPLLERLRGESDPERVLRTIPGIGAKLAERLHADLGIDSLEDLEVAVFDGRLKGEAGFGEKSVAAIRDVLAYRLGRRQPRSGTAQPPIDELLDVDREYREKAQAGTLQMIAPRRFNPKGEAWLPILHTRRGTRDYTALYSNTARAHELKMTHDWVVIYADDGSRELTSTVVTGIRGRMKGLRVVRGCEDECVAYYEANKQIEKSNKQDESVKAEG
jgi:DNA polymerase (family 10)